MASIIAKSVTLTTAFAAITASTTYGSCQLLAPTDNGNVAYIRGDDGSASVPIPKGVAFPLINVNLNEVLVKGSTPGTTDKVILIGYNRIA